MVDYTVVRAPPTFSSAKRSLQCGPVSQLRFLYRPQQLLHVRALGNGHSDLLLYHWRIYPHVGEVSLPLLINRKVNCKL